GKAGMLAIPQVTAGASDITLSVTREDKTQLNVELALRGRDIEHETARAGELTLTGKAQLSNDMKAVDANGNIVLEGGVLAAPQRQRVVSAIGSGAPFTGHGTALKAWLDEALSGFSAGTGLHYSHSEDGGWSLVSTGTVSAKTERGATLSLEPKGTKPAINIAAEGVEVSGLASLSGGRAPQLAALINSAQASRDGTISVEAGGVSLKPWTADGLTLGADLNEVHFTNASSVPRLQTVGEIEISGPFYGNTLAPTRLFGGIDAAFDAAGLRVQTYNTRCLGLDTAGVDLTGGIHIDDTSLQLCPRDGRVVRQNRGVYAGTVEFGSLSLPFRSEETSGALDLDTAVLDWRAGQTARLDVTANAMRVPLAFGGKTLNIAATGPQLAYETTRPATITAEVGATEFGGTLLPADLGLDSADFEARLAESGLNGTANARRVELRDPGTDPLYEPLTGDLSATFSNGVMNVTGPVTTPRAGQTIAEADLTLDLVSLDGTARVATPELAFRPGGFQPTALSDRVRGFLSNARGTMAAEATFTFDGGTPSGKGWVSVSDFGFDTLRLGAVNDVNGRLEFSDILSLSTPPGQTVTLGEINPGIPLKDGTIRFQLTNATQATIEEARWPFAGGELVVNRSSWTIAGTEDIVRIDARGLELTDIVSVFNLPDIQAQGTVSGSFPVEIVGPNAYIRDAVLKADESGGTIAYTGGIGDAASQADQRVDLAFKALRDFRFTVLELGVEGNLSGDMVISMKLVGRSPNVLDGAPFAFNIGIDSKLMQLINTGRSMTTTDWLATAVSTQAEDDETGNAEGGEPVD
ncbi:intermembrane phospholipid transport protein YdbH family protein, partial [Henriciella aquimarina]|uniref:intermembrane phospholipid transport protein YdbH family protein n=1 Tax=Henriciella aquimarina TaxID=545261 RepID=UPI0009FF156B